MTGVLLFVAGAAVGALVGWLAAVRFATPRPVPVSTAPDIPDDLLASDTATHMAAGIATESSFEAMAYLLVERCAARVGLPCALVMRERVGAAVHIQAVAGGLDNRLLGIEVPLDSPAGRAITGGIPAVGAPDEKVVSIDRRDRRRYSGGGVAVPVSQGGLVYGAVLAFGEPPAGAQDAIDGISLELKRLGAILVPAYSAAVSSKRAETDELTGLANRRVLSRLMGRHTPGDRVALIALDIDHFKSVNDTLGHEAGDAALRQMAKVLREAVRPRDTALRIGGEEFAVWLPGADLRTGEEIAERVRAAIAAAPFRWSGNERTLTVSCGVASYPVPIRAVENMGGAADAALYAAKRAGRNRVMATQAVAG